MTFVDIWRFITKLNWIELFNLLCVTRSVPDCPVARCCYCYWLSSLLFCLISCVANCCWFPTCLSLRTLSVHLLATTALTTHLCCLVSMKLKYISLQLFTSCYLEQLLVSVSPRSHTSLLPLHGPQIPSAPLYIHYLLRPYNNSFKPTCGAVYSSRSKPFLTFSESLTSFFINKNFYIWPLTETQSWFLVFELKF